MKTIFKKSIELNMKIEKFLDVISDSLVLFQKEIAYFLADDQEALQETLDRICILESEADELETDIKITLYKFMLLPDARADVLSLIKSLDDIIDYTEEITKQFCIQRPNFPSELHPSILELTHNTVKSADYLILAARAFLNEVHLASSYVSKINFYEHEVDILEDKINTAIFDGSLVTDLAEKLHLKSFVSRIARISDESERIGEKLTIFSIKREI